MGLVRLKYLGQIFIIFIYVYCVTFIFLTDIYGIPVNLISNLITNEFMASLARAEEETLTTEEFLKLYESYKEVQQARNKFFSFWTLMIFIVCITFYSVHVREIIDALGLTGLDVDLITRVSIAVGVYNGIMLFQMSADVCIK
ncbi:unnamed protein product, partial [Allacma fusca]